MNVYKYRINNGEYLFPEDLNGLKEGDIIECGLFEGRMSRPAEVRMDRPDEVRMDRPAEVRPYESNKLLYTVFPYVYKNGFFMKSVYDVGYKRLNVYYPKLPKDPYTEMVSRYIDQKMWCPVQ